MSDDYIDLSDLYVNFLVISTCQIFLSTRKRVYAQFVSSSWQPIFLTSQHKDQIFQKNHLTSRHNFLLRRHNIWQVRIIIWQVELIIWMKIFFKLAAILLFCVDFMPTLSVPLPYGHSYSIVFAKQKPTQNGRNLKHNHIHVVVVIIFN